MGYLFAGDAANFEDVAQSSPICLPFPAWCTENSAEMKQVKGVKKINYLTGACILLRRLIPESNSKLLKKTILVNGPITSTVKC